MSSKSSSNIPDSFETWLKGMAQQVAIGMVTPGATVRFCQALQLTIIGKLKQHGAVSGVGGAQGQPGAGGMGASGPGGPGGPPGGPGGADGSMTPQAPPGMSMPGNSAGGGAANPMMASQAPPGLMQGSPTPTPDELRRVIQQSTS